MIRQMDLGKDNIGSLFRKMFFPTLTGMLFMVIFIITDGIFVGHGLGSNALAAVNFVAPLMLISTGMGLMFGLGASVISSIHLSKGKVKAAQLIISQAITTSTLILTICTIFILIFPTQTLGLLGCPDSLMEECKLYAYGFVPFLPINSLLCCGGFYIRLNNAPRYAMICSISSAIINIILDYLFIFIFKFGIFGAAIATSIGIAIGSIMTLAYLCNKKHKLHLVKVRVNGRNFRSIFKNILHICNLGLSSLLGEASISCTMICSNYVFLNYMGEDGVAANSIYGYFSPLIYIIYNAISLSAQPIISFNYGTGNTERIRKTFNLAVSAALTCGTLLFLTTALFSYQISSMFINSSSPVHDLATNGLPLSAIGFLPMAVNIVFTCYLQSTERANTANTITILRGFIFMFISYMMLPKVLGNNGVWLAITATEFLATLVVGTILIADRKKHSFLHKKIL